MAPVDHQADIDAARSRPRLNAVATYEGLCSADWGLFRKLDSRRSQDPRLPRT